MTENIASSHIREEPLIVVPTRMELSMLVDRPADWLEAPDVGRVYQCSIGGRPRQVAACGFGLAVAGTGALAAIHNTPHRPSRVILVGCAGTYDPSKAPIGRAVVATSVRCVDVGLPVGPNGRLTANVPTLSPFPEEIVLPTSTTSLLSGAHGDNDPARHAVSGAVLSVAGPSEDSAMANQRRQQFPGALAEEMEGYAVAIACQLSGTPMDIVRGISNVAGDRDQSNWSLAEAFESVKRVLQIPVE